MPTDSTPAESTAANSAARDHADAAEPGAESGDGTADADRVAALERRVADLEAELEAVRGLLAGVEVVDESIDRRASTALAKAEALESDCPTRAAATGGRTVRASGHPTPTITPRARRLGGIARGSVILLAIVT
jgi:hypothetical protein